ANQWHQFASRDWANSQFSLQNHTHSNLSTGTGLTGSTYNGGTARTFAFDTTWGDNRYALDSHTHSTGDITSGTFPYSRLPISATQVSNWDDAYTHSEITSGNPHGVSYSNILGTQPVPTLLQTINAGNSLNSTATDIDLNGGSLNFIDTESIFLFHDNSIEFFMDNGTFRLSTNRDAPNNPFVSVQTNLLTDNRSIQFPDASGTLALTS